MATPANSSREKKFTAPVLLRFAQSARGIRNSQPNELS
jgi:hypothetical protein